MPATNAENREEIADVNGEVRIVVDRRSTNDAEFLSISARSRLTLPEARALARAITRACDSHLRWKRGER